MVYDATDIKKFSSDDRDRGFGDSRQGSGAGVGQFEVLIGELHVSSIQCHEDMQREAREANSGSLE